LKSRVIHSLQNAFVAVNSPADSALFIVNDSG
jgi:hypothetical protein